MPSLVVSVSTPWRDAADLVLSTSTPWRDAAEIVSSGSIFYLPDPPAGGTGTTAPTLDPTYFLPAAEGYDAVHVVTVTDTADGTTLELDSLSIATDDNSVCWTLSATGPASLFVRVSESSAPPVWEVSIDGMLWRFVIEGVRRSREFGRASVSLTGRSVTILSGEPYQAAVSWINDGPATAAQIVEQAQTYTDIETRWLLDDWLVPDRVWSYTGTPLAVARRVAEAVGAMVVSDRAEPVLTIMPRYRELSNRWPVIAPDVEIHADAIMVDGYERADRPAYNAVYVAGQQQGAAGLVRLSWMAGDLAAPLVTDLLLTDEEAVRQRGESILGGCGPQANVQAELPVLTGGTYPGVLDLGMLCRVVEPGAPTWWGMVRSVRVDVNLPHVGQAVTLERHTDTVDTTPDVLAAYRGRSEIVFLSSYLADFPSIEIIPMVFRIPAGDAPWRTMNAEQSEVAFANPTHANISSAPEYALLYSGLYGGFTDGYFNKNLPVPAPPGEYGFEVEIKDSGGAADLCFGVYGLGYGTGEPDFIVLLHQAGVTNPLNRPATDGGWYASGQRVPRGQGPKFGKGDIIGFAIKVYPNYATKVGLYVNGRLAITAASPAGANALFCGRLNPAIQRRAFVL